MIGHSSVEIRAKFAFECRQRPPECGLEVGKAILRLAEETEIFNDTRRALSLDQKVDSQKGLAVGHRAAVPVVQGHPLVERHHLAKGGKGLAVPGASDLDKATLALLGKGREPKRVQYPVGDPVREPFAEPLI